MTKQNQLAILKNRYETLKGTPKNIKCPGVLRKLVRQIRHLEADM